MSESSVDLGNWVASRRLPDDGDAKYVSDLLRRHPVGAVASMSGRSMDYVLGVAKLLRWTRDRAQYESAEARRRRIQREIEAANAKTIPAGRAQQWRQSLPSDASCLLHTLAYRHGLTRDDLTGPSRKAPISRARQEAMVAIYDLRKYSLPLIGSWFGGRHHTTVMHAVWKRDKARGL